MVSKTVFWSITFTLCFVSTLAQYGTPQVKVNKCCEPYEILMENHCVHINETNETIWHPMFSTEGGKSNLQVDYILIPGSPDCGSMQEWPIYYYKNSTDVLKLLPSGILRHYLLYSAIPGEEDETGFDNINGKEVMYQDYPAGKYCMEKRVEGGLVSEFAKVCAPEHHTQWSSTQFVMHNIVNPVTHGIAMICFLAVAIIYFIMPTLRDLVGNIVTTISMCLIVSQAADMIRLLTVFSNHISIIVADREMFSYELLMAKSTVIIQCMLGAALL